MRGQPFTLGKIAVGTPGTPVRLTTNTALRADSILFSPIQANTGRVLIGAVGMDKTALTGVIAEFSESATKFQGPLLLQDQTSQTSMQLSDYYVDADVANEGIIVTYWVN